MSNDIAFFHSMAGYAALVMVGFLGMVYGMGDGYKISISQATGAVLISMVLSIMASN